MKLQVSGISEIREIIDDVLQFLRRFSQIFSLSTPTPLLFCFDMDPRKNKVVSNCRRLLSTKNTYYSGRSCTVASCRSIVESHSW